MLSSRKYMEFEKAVAAILHECFVGVNSDPKPDNVSLSVDGHIKLTEDNKYCFQGDLEAYRDALISICEALPKHPPVREDSCATIDFRDLLPDDIPSQEDFAHALELADEFLALLERNQIGIVDHSKGKYEWPIIILNRKFEDRLSMRDLSDGKSRVVNLLRRDAENGDAKAQYLLGNSYLRGEGVEKDEATAARWYQKAANQGNADAQYKLGRCYEKGLGVKQDDKQAVHWFTESARKENFDALVCLGLHSVSGKGCEKNWESSFRAFQFAAECGHKRAQLFVGNCYEDGVGVEKNDDKAVEAYEKAVQMGEEEAADCLEKLRSKMREAREKERAAQLKAAKNKSVELVTIVAAVLSGVIFHWAKEGFLQHAADSSVAPRWILLAITSAFAFWVAGSYIFPKHAGAVAGIGAFASVFLVHYSQYPDRYPHTELIFLVLMAAVILLVISQILKKNRRCKQLSSETDKSSNSKKSP